MQEEIKQNYIDKMRLVSDDLLSKLDQEIKIMMADHSSKGLLRSGNTIRKTMDFIAGGNAQLYKEVLGHLSVLRPIFNSQLEADIQGIAETGHGHFKQGALIHLKQSTETSGNPALYERMLPDVEVAMAIDLANFKNSLNASILELKTISSSSPLTKTLWGIELLLISVGIFIAGMWWKDPSGNYEPILVVLGFVASLAGFAIKFSSKHKVE